MKTPFVFSIPAREDNYIHALIDQKTQSVLLVDPSEPGPALRWLKQNSNLQLQGILITHHHYDHTEGIPELLQFKKVPVYAPWANLSQIPMVTNALYGGETLNFDDGFALDVIATPGHTQGHIVYYEPKLKWLFCGDTFFNLSCGRVFDGTPEQLFESLQKIKRLPRETLLYSAHEYTLSGFPFCFFLEPNHPPLQNYHQWVVEQRRQQKSTVPISLELAIQVNPYLKAQNFVEFQSIRKKREIFQINK